MNMGVCVYSLTHLSGQDGRIAGVHEFQGSLAQNETLILKTMGTSGRHSALVFASASQRRRENRKSGVCSRESKHFGNPERN